MKSVVVMVAVLIAATVSALANPVEVRFAGLGGQNQNGGYTYPYFLTIDNGRQIPMMCDDFYHNSNIGDTWQANVTALSSSELSNTRFSDLNLYEKAGFLLMQINDGIQPEWGNINFAVWKIFNPSVNMGDAPAGTFGPQYWYDLALSTDVTNMDFSSVMILTPLDAHSQTGDQEFLFVTPEPGTLLLIGGGLLGLFPQRKRLA